MNEGEHATESGMQIHSFTSVENVLFSQINLVSESIIPLLQIPGGGIADYTDFQCYDYIWLELVYSNLPYSHLTSLNT